MSFSKEVLARARRVVLALALLAGCAVTTAPAAPAAPNDLGRDLRAYLTQPGDRVLVVPDGRYTGGPVSAPHPVTNGSLRGRLVLVAESRGGVVVDLGAAPLDLGPGTSQITFVGFRFVNGTVDLDGTTGIRFWYTDHTFPIETWHDAYLEAGRDTGPMANRTPTAIRVRNSAAVSVQGSNLHDIGDDAITGYNTTSMLLEGVRVTNVDEERYDPADLFHNDAIGTVGSFDRLTVRDSYLGQRVYIGAENSPQADVSFERVWMTRSKSAGVVFYAEDGNRVTGRRVDVRSWGHLGRGGRDRIDEFADGTQCHGRSVNCRQAINVVDTRIVRAAPPAGTLDPSTLWRAANQYDSWLGNSGR